MKVLFVCTANRYRSRTAEEWFIKNYPQYEVQPCGINKFYVEDTIKYHYPKAQIITKELLEWADKIYIFEKYHFDTINNLFGFEYNNKIINLYIDDIYEYNDKNLIQLISERLFI